MVSGLAVRTLLCAIMETALQLECDGQLAGVRTDSKAQGQSQFTMVQRGDFIKPGWWHWRCRREDDAGDVAYGYVQADSLGRTVVPETFVNDRK